ncbi:Glyco hydro 2 domain containing protein [Asbolus verrucosus]|uniref:beta-mannosidase n=1 Tax=Asbolus verrucosus TaxID=1661398 RepID=A0A482VIF7_ASBVE|nr:Glyco hydro 2 domain containing protein [Asbolus verrucosus]
MAGSVEIFILILGATLCSSLTRQNLGGQWGATGGDAGIIISNATVPGGIFSDLMNSGEIGDIFYGTGDSDYSWVGLSDWTYSTTFTVDEELLAHANVHLVFEGLDTFATILINGQEVGTSQNMFVRYVFDVKQQLQFSSPVNVAAALANETINDYVIPPECPDEQYNGICHANRIRKMQASFSWDWGPAFASVGIWKDVYLEAFNDAVIKYVVASPSKNTDGSWKLSVTTYLTARGPVAGIVSVILETENGTPVLVDVDVQEDVSVDGEIAVTKYLDVSADLVNTWWPNGYGTQDLYNLKVTFTGENEQDEKTVRVGFRTVELIQEQLEQGLSFYFKVNGYPIFAMGANEIPLSVLPERGQNRETIRQVLQTVKDVNMNMLRVWGGGVYESDYFYDLADEFGILIWHDFMFACAMYPADSVYLSNVVDEVRHQLKRLGSHTSIAVWAGNNENESALSQNWYGTGNNFDLYKNDYIKLYVDTIQPEVLKIVPGTIFITSSPTNGAESDQEGHVAQNPSDPLYGDGTIHMKHFLALLPHFLNF